MEKSKFDVPVGIEVGIFALIILIVIFLLVIFFQDRQEKNIESPIIPIANEKSKNSNEIILEKIKSNFDGKMLSQEEKSAILVSMSKLEKARKGKPLSNIEKANILENINKIYENNNNKI